jgi:sensor domain CHASE-containing protein
MKHKHSNGAQSSKMFVSLSLLLWTFVVSFVVCCFCSIYIWLILLRDIGKELKGLIKN